MADFEVIDDISSEPSDLSPVAARAAAQIPFTLLFFIFLIFMLLSSDIFNKRILSRVDGAVGYNDCPTTYGTVIVGLLLVFFVAIIDFMIKKEII